MEWIEKVKILGISILLVVGMAFSVHAQSNISLRVELNETLSNSQSIDIKSLVANDGQGPNLFRMYLINENGSEYVNNLYFEIIISSDKIGRIAEMTQRSGQPFSLSPGQQVYATNNNIGNGLPGVEELIQFNGDLTPEGEEFVNNLQGNTTLPADRYTIEINLYQGEGQQSKLASDVAEIGTNIVEDTQDFYLLSPGDVLDSDATILNPYPNFQWQGVIGNSYRLIVVEAKQNESPQSLLDGAASTDPTQTNGSPNGGSLVDYEMLDRVVSQSSLQYPSSGIQSLEPGNTYYWRIIGQRRTSSGQQARKSEIWSFTVADNQNHTYRASQVNGLREALQSVLGERFEQVSQQGYSFESIVIDGQEFQGGQAMQRLRELNRKAENGEVSIVIEN